uniref:Uncharacterized protein n=1 Tax=Coptotermes formosanus TaxID=36987 RepID=R4V0K9_COPFO|nr:hypothetical protein [Coptotermes formosanus]
MCLLFRCCRSLYGHTSNCFSYMQVTCSIILLLLVVFIMFLPVIYHFRMVGEIFSASLEN